MDTFICVRYSNKGNTCRTEPVYQYDKGIQLHVLNLNESHIVQIHYSISGMYQALTQTPTYEVDKWVSNIPNVLLAQQEEIQAYIYVSDGEDSSQTVMHISIPVTPRPKPDGYEYTEAELKGLDYVLSQVSEAVAGVDDAIAKAYAAYEHIPYIDVETNHWMQWDVLTEQFVDTGIIAIGQPGKDGSDGKDGLDGKDGKDFVILGVVATADELTIKVPNPEQGDHYNVGPDNHGMYLLYMYDTELGWVDKGIANGGGSGNIIMDFDDNIPKPLGEGSPGTSESPSRSDHEHPMPTAKDVGALFVDESGAIDGQPAPVNADTLGGIPASNYVQKGEIPSVSGSLPEGGTAGQILTKNSETNGDASWKNPPTSIPSGGEKGQVLTKNGDTDGDASWQDAASGLPEGGTAGQVLYKKADGAEWKDLPEQQKELPEGGTAGQILTKNSSGVEWTNKLELDTTLKASNKAADAKATGDALNQLSQQIENFEGVGLKSDPQEDENVVTPEFVSVPFNCDMLDGKTYQQIVDLIYPIGRTITTLSDADNPNTLYPWQVWERTAKGRMIIGTGAPDNNDDGTSPGSYNYALGSKGGEEKHKLVVSELASHEHVQQFYAKTLNGKAGTYAGAVYDANVFGTATGTTFAENEITLGMGDDQPHNNMSPYIAANIWKRVS